MKLRVLSRATRDLEKIQAYIEVDDPNSAARVGLAIVKAMELIRQNPNVGRPTAGRPTREWSIPRIALSYPLSRKGRICRSASRVSYKAEKAGRVALNPILNDLTCDQRRLLAREAEALLRDFGGAR